MRIVLTGGGTGGHLVPFEPIVDTLRTVFNEDQAQIPKKLDNQRLDIYFLGVLNKEGEEFFKRLSVVAINIPAAKLRRYPSSRTFTDLLWRLPIGMVKSLFYMWRIMPDVVISKGGYGSIPVSLAAVFYRVPFLVHESDAILGLSNKLMAGLASVITVGFATTRHEMRFYKDKTVVTGTPVRDGFYNIDQAAAKRTFGLDQKDPVLLVMGGSQGAEEINNILLQVLPSLIKDMSIIHITGKGNLEAVQSQAGKVLSEPLKHAYQPYDYLTDKMIPALMAADVVVTRAGATSLGELARIRKPIIIIPLDTAAQEHQRRNAQAYEATKSARVIDPANLGRSLFEQNVRALMTSAEIRATLGSNIARMDHAGASRDIVSLSLKLAAGLAARQPGRNARTHPNNT